MQQCLKRKTDSIGNPLEYRQSRVGLALFDASDKRCVKLRERLVAFSYRDELRKCSDYVPEDFSSGTLQAIYPISPGNVVTGDLGQLDHSRSYRR